MAAARRINEHLIAPLELSPAGEVIVVPGGPVQGPAWSAIPDLWQRPVTVAPSAQMWLHAERAATPLSDNAGFVGGPNLEFHREELEELGGLYAHVHAVVPPEATPSRATRLFQEFDTVHVAAHGRFRRERPLLSTIQLDGGEVPMADIIPSSSPTKLTVLASCEGGRQAALPGNEVLGVVALLMTRSQVSTVVAPTAVVADRECGEFAISFHRHLSEGLAAAAALAEARGAIDGGHQPRQWAAAASFHCFGTGTVRRA